MYNHYFKPALDFFLSVLAVIVLSPVLLVIALFIKLDSKGPVLFIQERLGKGEKVFNLYKFRTMTHKDRSVHRQIFDGDPEVTRVGGVLRRIKFDELPQLFNVLKGEMAIVGPRPCLASLRAKFDENTHYRFLVKPGLTSLAALKGSIYLGWDEKWYYDRLYVEKMNFTFDVEIIFKTIILVLIGEKKFAEKSKKNGN